MLELPELTDSLREFWPRRGPRWDALAICDFDDRTERGVLLAEGKSYPLEQYSGGTRAGATGSDAGRRSRQQIERSIAWVQSKIRIPVDPSRWIDPPPGKRSGSPFQTANRIAHAVWFNDQVVDEAKIDAWLCHLLFVGDPTHIPRLRTTQEQWERALRQIDVELGLGDVDVPFIGHCYLPGVHPDVELRGL
jgi:hypothetical protein